MDESLPANAISGDVLDAAYKRRGHRVERQVPVSVRYENVVFDVGFRADLVVDGEVLVELESVERVAPASLVW